MRNQRGFTLVELLVAIAITGIIGSTAAMSVQQVIMGTTLSNDKNTAINNVRNAGYWISRDVQMAQPSKIKDSDELGANELANELLYLGWQEWGGSPHTVNYTLQDGELWRDYDGGKTLIAQYIKPKQNGVTDCHWDGEVLTGNITAQVSGKIETRTFQVKPRPD
jgi:prepilin-type N-terminal cleavage/methylation domain-containing protein